jgi:hypothetical protein
MCSEMPDTPVILRNGTVFGSPPFAPPLQGLGTKHLPKSKKVTETGQTSPQKAGL